MSEMVAKKRSGLQRYVEYTGTYVYGDKVLKAIGYSCSSTAAILRMRNGGEDTPLSASLQKLYSEISMNRCAMRYTGTTDALDAVIYSSWAGDWSDPKIKPLSRIQGICMAIYHPLEHLGWASYIAPKLFPYNGAWLFARSSWAWLLYIYIDVYMNTLKLKEIKRREAAILLKARTHPDGTEIAALKALKTLRWKVQMQQWRNVFYIPNCTSWCFEKPPFPKAVVAFLGLAEALVGIRMSFPPA